MFEFVVFKHPQATGLGAYRDVIGDLSMDMLGAAIAAGIILVTPSLRLSAPLCGEPEQPPSISRPPAPETSRRGNRRR